MAPAPIHRLRAARPTLEQRLRRRIVAYRSAPGTSDGGRLRGGMHAQRALQQIGLERGDLVCAGAGRPSQDRPSRRGGRCVRPLWCCFVTLECELLDRRISRSTPRRAWRSSSSSRASTIGAGATRCWATSRRPRSRTTRGRRHMSTPGAEIHGAQRRHSAPLRGPRAGRHANGPHCGPLRSLPPERGTLRDPLIRSSLALRRDRATRPPPATRVQLPAIDAVSAARRRPAWGIVP